MTTIKLDPGAALLLDALHGAGHAAYAVGGCVRDSLLGLDPHDWDLCTSARPEQVMALFGEEKCIPTGLQHGTVTVKQGGRLYETTTFRTEGAYSDGRHPDAVCFVPDVREDLARRDFTINAMAYSAEEGLIDPFGGRGDLAAHLVPDFVVPSMRPDTAFAGGGALGKLANGAIAAILRPYPKLHRADCVGCRKCAQICPAHAITMQSGRPSIDRRACIHCFCCQEFCPKGAMCVGRTPIARLLNK